MADADPVRVALVGLGNSGRFYHLPHLRSDPRFDLRAVAASSPATLAAADLPPGVDRVFGWADAVARDDVDLVVLALPHHLHHPAARAALDAGHHVLVEKPLAVTTTEADDLLARARAAGRVLAVHHQRHWEDDARRLADLVRSGALGEVWHVAAHRGHQGPYVTHGPDAPHAGDRPVAWVTRREAGGGVGRLIGPHPIEHVLDLAGAQVVAVAGRRHLAPGEDVEDWLAVDLTLTGGRTARVEVARRLGAGLPRFVVRGSAGTAVAPDGTRVDVLLHDGRAWTVTGLAPPGVLGAEVYDDVHAAIRSGRRLRVPVERARDVVAVLEAAEVSAARGGAPVPLPRP
jgi:predicted dehydrogenase